MMRFRRTALLVVLVTARASADAKVDWARALVIADGIGVADRHAPSPAVARGTSRRAAEDAAKKQIAAKLAELPVAAGGRVGEAKDGDRKARLARAIDDAITLAAEPETDGAWRVTMAVPIEGIRQAMAGPREVGADGDHGPQVVVVEGVNAKPAVGWKIGALEAPTLWVSAIPDWARSAPHAKAKSAKAGVIDVPGSDATAATLFVIVMKP